MNEEVFELLDTGGDGAHLPRLSRNDREIVTATECRRSVPRRQRDLARRSSVFCIEHYHCILMEQRSLE